MKITVDPKIHEYELFEKTVERSNPELQEFAEESAEEVQAEWIVDHGDNGQPNLTLRLTNSFGTVAKTFPRDDLEYVAHVSFRVHFLWVELLQLRTKKLVQKLFED